MLPFPLSGPSHRPFRPSWTNGTTETFAAPHQLLDNSKRRCPQRSPVARTAHIAHPASCAALSVVSPTRCTARCARDPRRERSRSRSSRQINTQRVSRVEVMASTQPACGGDRLWRLARNFCLHLSVSIRPVVFHDWGLCSRADGVTNGTWSTCSSNHTEPLPSPHAPCSSPIACVVVLALACVNAVSHDESARRATQTLQAVAGHGCGIPRAQRRRTRSSGASGGICSRGGTRVAAHVAARPSADGVMSAPKKRT